jgi:hypothetical protein
MKPYRDQAGKGLATLTTAIMLAVRRIKLSKAGEDSNRTLVVH